MLFNFSDKNHTTIYAFVSLGRGWQNISLFFHDNVIALFAITFSGGNGIVLFLLTLGLTAQKRLARAERLASPRVNVPNDFRPASGKSVTSIGDDVFACCRTIFGSRTLIRHSFRSEIENGFQQSHKNIGILSMLPLMLRFFIEKRTRSLGLYFS